MILTSCPAPLSPTDTAVRSIDTVPPQMPAVSVTQTTPYDTTAGSVEWTWSTGGGGSNVFRYRVNGGEWTTVTDVFSATLDAVVTPVLPGTYRFELQERDAAGNWSPAGASTVEILPAPPAGVELFLDPGYSEPYPVTEVARVAATELYFQWAPPPVQNGRPEPPRYRVRLDRRVDDTWHPVEPSRQTTVPRWSTGDLSNPDAITIGRYRFQVAAWNTSDFSTPVTLEVAIAPQTAYTGPTPTDDTTPALAVTGVADAVLQDTYQWVIDGTPTGEAFSGTGTVGDTFSALLPDQTEGIYNVAVRQQKGDGSWSDAGPAATVTIVTSPPPPVTGVTATITGDDQWELSWDESAFAEGYRVRDGFGTLLTELPAGVTTVDKATLGYTTTAGPELFLSVRGYNVHGEGPGSDIIFAPMGLGQLGIGGGPAGGPASPDVVAPADAEFDWSTFPGVDTYNVYVSTSQAEVDELAPAVRTEGVTPPFDPTTVLGPLVVGETYYWTISAVNSAGELAHPTRAFTVANPGISISESALTVSEGPGGNATFDVVLDTTPADDVIILMTGQTGDIDTDPLQLTFTPTNWDTAQTVTVTAIDDTDPEGVHTDELGFAVSSPDADYDVLTPDRIDVTIQDNDFVTVTYLDTGADTGTPPEDTTQYSPGDTATAAVNGAGGNWIVQAGATLAGWTDGSQTLSPGEQFSIGTSDITLEPVWDTATLYAGGSGTSADPYRIATLEHLNNVRANLGDPTVHFLQTQDIDMAPVSGWYGGAGWIEIGPGGSPAGQFVGTYDGGYHRIRNLYIDSSANEVGLIGSTGTGVRIENLVMVDPDVTGGNAVGAVAGDIEGGEIVNVAVVRTTDTSGHITGADYVGAIVGLLRGGRLESSFADVTSVTADPGRAGGLVGGAEQATTIVDSHVVGRVTTTSIGATGGAIGSIDADSIVRRVYAAVLVQALGSAGGLIGSSQVALVLDSYYDTDVSGMSDNDGRGVPRPTADMVQQALYSNWDFTGTWVIADGSSYPYLQWAVDNGLVSEFPGLPPAPP